MPTDNSNSISKIRGIVSVERVHVTKESIKTVAAAWKNSDYKAKHDVFVYRIVYMSRGKKIVGYIAEPQTGKKLPCIIVCRGGAKDFSSINIHNHYAIIPLALYGYVTISTQYPGVEGGEGIDRMGSEDDVASVLDLYKILKSYSRVDIKNIGMLGFSRGGAMVYRCLARVRYLKAVVIGSASVDEVSMAKWRKGWKDYQQQTYGGSLHENKKRSVMYWVENLAKKTPILIMNGSSDNRVNAEDTLRLLPKLSQHKIPYRFILYEGTDHYLGEHKKEFRLEILRWFDRFIRQKEPLPNVELHGK